MKYVFQLQKYKSTVFSKVNYIQNLRKTHSNIAAKTLPKTSKTKMRTLRTIKGYIMIRRCKSNFKLQDEARIKRGKIEDP